MGDKPISFRDENGNFVSAADVWNAEKLEELFNKLNPKRKLRLEREALAKAEEERWISPTRQFSFSEPSDLSRNDTAPAWWRISLKEAAQK